MVLLSWGFRKGSSLDMCLRCPCTKPSFQHVRLTSPGPLPTRPTPTAVSTAEWSPCMVLCDSVSMKLYSALPPHPPNTHRRKGRLWYLVQQSNSREESGLHWNRMPYTSFMTPLLVPAPLQDPLPLLSLNMGVLLLVWSTLIYISSTLICSHVVISTYW